MKKTQKKKKPKYRIPMEAVLKLRSHPVETKEGKKRYSRKSLKQQNRKIFKEESLEENN